MRTVPEEVSRIVKNYPLIEEGMAQGIINLSAFARKIKPLIEQRLFKEVTEASIMMALRRMEEMVQDKTQATSTWKISDITVRSHLVELTYTNSGTLFELVKSLLQPIEMTPDGFLTITRGIQETTLLLNQKYMQTAEKLLEGQHLRGKIENLSAITIRLPENAVEIMGMHYSILKLLTWEGVNIIEEVSTYTEFSIIVRDEDVEKAFQVLNSLGK